MKKFLILLMATVMVFALAACGDSQKTEEPAEADGITAIPLGGDLPDFELSGESYGVYEEIEFGDGVDLGEGTEGHLYYCEDSNTPLIAVYRWAKDGQTLEEATKEEADLYEAGGYQMASWTDMGLDSVGYFNDGEVIDGNYLYVDVSVMEDGDDFVELAFYAATEEVALGDSGKYVWVPKGYTDLLDDEAKEHEGIFYGEYSEDYYLPGIWISEDTDDYDDFAWLWSDVYPEMPVDKATYDSWEAAGWDDASINAYIKAFNIKNEKLYNETVDGCTVSAISGELDNSRVSLIYIVTGDDVYYASLYTDLEVKPLYGKTFVDSIHSK